jgi:hypothetical protein
MPASTPAEIAEFGYRGNPVFSATVSPDTAPDMAASGKANIPSGKGAF